MPAIQRLAIAAQMRIKTKEKYGMEQFVIGYSYLYTRFI